ncbi:hypothetical protein QUF18_00545 [Pseudochrobactrum kiredjianiae]|uniref:DUF4142 domain-containing protein n=2 Tax=Pseudochrobactrum kiredjianiae TaxID=386305 RepID=A0ABW3V7I4_9HYPH|nr:hypothetical protein [Pseudochrobactrum kiredjianiae]
MAGSFFAVACLSGLPLTDNQAFAQSFSEMAKPEVPAEVNNFPLDEAFLTRMEAAQAELNTIDMSGEGNDEDGTGDHSPKALAARIDKQPKVKAVLEKHGLTAQDYIYGYFALVSSVSAVEAEDEDQIVDELKGINPAHIAFGKKYLDRIHKLMGE